MAKRALDIAKLIFEAEPDALGGDPEAVQRISQALAKIHGAILATTLVREGEEALREAVRKVAKTVELEARETTSMMPLLWNDAGDPPEDTIN